MVSDKYGIYSRTSYLSLSLGILAVELRQEPPLHCELYGLNEITGEKS